ncbi:MAG: hypothetical protein KDC88_17935, partial [Ignavibacteriae bacterium]|nr:hypothetical protein [Ignavibacteriota bacterium]
YFKKYQLTLKYNNKVDAEEEVKLLTELFGKNEYIFEKDANELEVSMPNQNIELFISNLEQNKNVVNIQLL